MSYIDEAFPDIVRDRPLWIRSTYLAEACREVDRLRAEKEDANTAMVIAQKISNELRAELRAELAQARADAERAKGELATHAQISENCHAHAYRLTRALQEIDEIAVKGREDGSLGGAVRWSICLSGISEYIRSKLSELPCVDTKLAALTAELEKAKGEGVKLSAILAYLGYEVSPTDIKEGDRILIDEEAQKSVTIRHVPGGQAAKDQSELVLLRRECETIDTLTVERDTLLADKARLTPGSHLIVEERNRQINTEGWDAGHDDGHDDYQMTQAAVAYATHATKMWKGGVYFWPWGLKWWKPSDDPRADLVKAGALIAAELDRLLRIVAARATEGRAG